MKSLCKLGNDPTSLPLSADDITELHAARLLLLVQHCGAKNSISGLTKLAKLDFFVRYPAFFDRLSCESGEVESTQQNQVESSMVRHHYGPWDKRYYQVLAFLESRQLLQVEKRGQTFNFTLTDMGKVKATALSKEPPFEPLVAQMKAVKKVLGRKSGTQLKKPRL